jgi:hypothetical protein
MLNTAWSRCAWAAARARPGFSKGCSYPSGGASRLDLLGESVDDQLIHLELQSSNDASMPLRMAEEVGDNVIAILAHLRDYREAVRKILEETVEQEVPKMPIHIDILENRVLGREFKKALQEGRQEGPARNWRTSQHAF